jgi:hypothetical protein
MSIYPKTNTCGWTKDTENWMKQHTTCDFMLESSDWDGELDPKRCCARMWRGGFGGQCGKQAVVFDENLERWSVCENGWRLGLCKNHSGQLAKKGKLTHGYFDEVPEEFVHAWRWRHDKKAWIEIEEDKKNPH